MLITEDRVETEKIDTEKSELEFTGSQASIRLEAGSTYVIQCSVPLYAEAAERFREYIEREEVRLGVKFLVLANGFSIATERVSAA